MQNAAFKDARSGARAMRPGKRYFDCAPKTGLFVRPDKIGIDAQDAATTRIQSLQRARKERSRVQQDQAFQTWNQIEGADELQHLQGSRALAVVDSYMESMHGPAPPSHKTGLATREIEPSYAGPHLTWPITRAQAVRLVAHFKEAPGVKLHAKYAAWLIEGARDAFRRTVQSAVFDLDLHEGRAPWPMTYL